MNNLAKKVKNSGTGKMMHGTEKVVHTVDSFREVSGWVGFSLKFLAAGDFWRAKHEKVTALFFPFSSSFSRETSYLHNI